MGGRPTHSLSRDAQVSLRSPLPGCPTVSDHSTLPGVACCPSTPQYSTFVSNSTRSESSFNPTLRSTSIVRGNRNTATDWPNSCQGSLSESMPSVESASSRTTEMGRKVFPTSGELVAPFPIHRDSSKAPVRGLAPFANPSICTPLLGYQERTLSKHDEICRDYTQGQCSMGASCHRKHIPPPAPPNARPLLRPFLALNEDVNSQHRPPAERKTNKQINTVSCHIQRNVPNAWDSSRFPVTETVENIPGKGMEAQGHSSSGELLPKGPPESLSNANPHRTRPRWSKEAIFRDRICWNYMNDRCSNIPRNCNYIHLPPNRWPEYMEKEDQNRRNYQQNQFMLGNGSRFVHKEPETMAVSEKATAQSFNSATAITADPNVPAATETNSGMDEGAARSSEPLAGATTQAPPTLIASKRTDYKVESTASSTEAIIGQTTINLLRETGKADANPTTTDYLSKSEVGILSLAPLQKSSVQSPPTRGQMCFNFANRGCSRARCPYLHLPSEEWRKYIEKSDELCRDFQRGSCPRGIGCWYIHPLPVQTDTSGCATSARIDAKAASSEIARPGCSNGQIRDVDSTLPVKAPQAFSAPAKELAIQGTSEMERSETLVTTRKGRKEPKDHKKPSSLKENASENTVEKAALSSTGTKKATPTKGNIIPTSTPIAKHGPLTSKQNVESVETSQSPSSGYVPNSESSKGKQGRNQPISKGEGKTGDPLKDKNKEKDRQPADVKSGICLEYLAGHYSAKRCQQSHPKHPDRPESKLKKNVNPAPNTPEDDESSNRCKQTSEQSSAAPAVPPGLGLEDKAELELRPRLPPAMFTVFDSARVALGPGFEVKTLKTGFESRAVLLNAPVETDIASVKQVLTSFGEILDVQNLGLSKDPGMANFRAFFADHRNATRAVNTLQNTTPFGKPLDIKLGSRRSTALGGVFSDGEVELQFPAPGRTAFVGYQSKQDAETAMELARGTDMEGIRIRPMLHNGIPKVGTFTVRFDGLPPSWEPISLTWFGVNQGVMLEGFNYSHLDHALNSLHDTLQQFGDLDPISVLSEPTLQGLIRAWAHFKSPEAADRCCAELNGRKQRFIGGAKLYAKHIRSVKYHLSSEIYKAVTVDIRLVRSQNCSRDHFSDIVVLDKREPIIVKVVANEMSKLNQVKSRVEQVLRGYVLKENGVTVWDPFFVRAPGVILLQQLQEENAGVLIERNIRLRTITLFGPPHLRHIVEDSIMDTVRRLRRHQTRTFLLKSQLIPLFMSADLYKLQDELGHENVVFDLARRMLTVRGNEDAYQVVQLAILHASRRGGTKRRTGHNTCPVCFDNPSSPVTLTCGHTWCKSCLSSYLWASTDNRMFPLSCLGEEARCSQPILLEVAREVLSPREFESIVQTAATAYVESRPSEFHYCPTPDCPQVYRTVSHDKPLQCPSCLVRICPRCHSEYHEESACPELEKQHEVLFAEWSKDHDVKSCPGCKAPIERIAGCNHMTCTRCRTHICWVCMRTFSNTRNVYDHMHDVHGGIGL